LADRCRSVFGSCGLRTVEFPVYRVATEERLDRSVCE
jgi:hypothetical protein